MTSESRKYPVLGVKVVKNVSKKTTFLGLRCHLFSREGGGPKRTTLSLCYHVTIDLGRVGVKGILDNVTKYDVFIF